MSDKVVQLFTKDQEEFLVHKIQNVVMRFSAFKKMSSIVEEMLEEIAKEIRENTERE